MRRWHITWLLVKLFLIELAAAVLSSSQSAGAYACYVRAHNCSSDSFAFRLSCNDFDLGNEEWVKDTHNIFVISKVTWRRLITWHGLNNSFDGSDWVPDSDAKMNCESVWTSNIVLTCKQSLFWHKLLLWLEGVG